MAENRLARELETRTEFERPKSWQPAALLPEPDKQPGYEYRWVRVSVLGQADPRNFSSAVREGWEPVRIEEQPKFRVFLDPNSRYKDNVEVGGLLLCKTPVEFVQQRRDYYAKKSLDQVQSVDSSFMRENDSRMPLFAEKRSSTSFGKGK
jgi:hypothetical protein